MNAPALPDERTAAPENRASRRATASDTRRGVSNTADDDLAFYDRSEILRRVPWSSTTLWRMTKKGFPQPVQISPGRVAWPKKLVDDWIRSKMEAANVQAP